MERLWETVFDTHAKQKAALLELYRALFNKWFFQLECVSLLRALCVVCCFFFHPRPTQIVSVFVCCVVFLSLRFLIPPTDVQLKRCGFNLLFYGAGSKKQLLDEFATLCAKSARAQLVTVNGFDVTLTYKQVCILWCVPALVQSFSLFMYKCMDMCVC